jgi:hypothetical protein
MLKLIIAIAITTMIWNQGTKILGEKIQSVKIPETSEVIEKATSFINETDITPVKIIKKKTEKKKILAKNNPIVNPMYMQNITAYKGYDDYYADAEPIGR